MVLCKGVKSFISDFDFTESIITGVRWDLNLLDMLILVYYDMDRSEGRKNCRELTIRLKHCRKANFNIDRCLSLLQKEELNNYILSWYTITNILVEEENGLINLSIKTVDDNPKWLEVVCEEILIEGENIKK